MTKNRCSVGIGRIAVIIVVVILIVIIAIGAAASAINGSKTTPTPQGIFVTSETSQVVSSPTSTTISQRTTNATPGGYPTFTFTTFASFLSSFPTSAASNSYTIPNCTNEGGAGNIGLVVLNSTGGKPIEGLHVQVFQVDHTCGIANAETLDQGSSITNSNGSIGYFTGIAEFFFDVRYNNSMVFQESGQAGPGPFLTCVSLYIPSGKVVVTSSIISSNNSPKPC